MHKVIIASLLLAICVSCGKTGSVSYFCDGRNQEKNIKHETISIETIKMDSISSSFMGSTIINNGRILFADYRFCWVFQFDKEGKFLSRHLGQGRAGNEIPTNSIDGWTTSSKGDFIFMDGTNNLYFTDNDFKKTSRGGISLSKDAQITDKYERFSDTYSFVSDKLQLKSYGNYLYVNIVADSPEFNLFSPDFSAESRILSKIDSQNGELVRIMGRITPQYTATNGNAFPYMNFDINDDGDFYVAFEVDSLIYVYDKDFKIKTAFGYAGANMNTNYNKVSMETFRTDYPQERSEKGFYNSVKVIGDYCFRGYNKGNNNSTEGLQIYKKHQLIADVEVPAGFRVAGYIPPYYYSEIVIDEPHMSISRFKL